MSIVLEHITKRYSGYAVVNAVSLEVADGEFFVLLGPSGSGKSTILRMIAGLNGVDAGRVTLHGRDVTELPPQQRETGFVFQHYALFPHMTVAENVEFGLRVRRVDSAERRRRRDELLELVGLAGLGGRLPQQLSGGQQQRVALARALAPRPSVLLLDEPFGALDAKIRLELRRSLRQIQHELGITTIFVTHDQEEAFELGDRLGVMNAGRLLEVGPPDELYLRPRTEFTATFLGSANLLLGMTTPIGVQLGPLHFPLQTEPGQASAERRVQVLFRPEDIALASAAEHVTGVPLGQAEVEQITFAGTYERVRLRLPRLPGVRPIAPPPPFGSDFFLLEATRTPEAVRRFSLQSGTAAWVGVQRIHALVHPGLGLLLVTDGSLVAQAALDLGSQLARLAHARVTVLGVGLGQERMQDELRGTKEHLASSTTLQSRTTAEPPAVAVIAETEHQPYDLVVLGAGQRNDLDLIEQVLAAGEHHVLLVSRAPASLPRRVLICVAGNEPSKEDVLFAGRLLRHLGAQATLLAVLDSHGTETPEHDGGAGRTTDAAAHAKERERMERFLEAGARTLSLLDVPAQTMIRSGRIPETIQTEMTNGAYDLLVLGAPLRPLPSARIRPFLTGEVEYPVLIVRSPYAEAGMARSGAGAPSVIEEII